MLTGSSPSALKNSSSPAHVRHTRHTRQARTRAKPLLGTVVEIAIQTDDEAAFILATDAAFARIAEIHRAMSFHEATSDLAAIANTPAGVTLSVAPDTWNTLLLALEIEAVSNGVFNPTIAPTLVQRGVLPPPANSKYPAQLSRLAESISLESHHRLCILKRVWIDLGGIAKGYAVDEAVATLQSRGINSGVVNAGGDLRTFGDVAHTVAVRVPPRTPSHKPSQPTQVLPIATLENLSCATSAMYYTEADVIVGRRDLAAQKHASVSVIAASCAVADALTKVVWLQDPDSIALRATLEHFNAHAALLNDAGQLSRI